MGLIKRLLNSFKGPKGDTGSMGPMGPMGPPGGSTLQQALNELYSKTGGAGVDGSIQMNGGGGIGRDGNLLCRVCGAGPGIISRNSCWNCGAHLDHLPRPIPIRDDATRIMVDMNYFREKLGMTTGIPSRFLSEEPALYRDPDHFSMNTHIIPPKLFNTMMRLLVLNPKKKLR